MADQEAQAPPAETQEKKSGILRKVGLVAAAVIVPAVVGLGVFMFVLAPMFAEPDDAGDGLAADQLPPTATFYDFTGLRATVGSEGNDEESPALLQYSVTFVCANLETYALIEAKPQLFQAMLVDLHDSRTRTELNDPVAKRSRLRRAEEDGNAILIRIQEEQDPAIEILEVRYTEHTVIPL